MTRTYTVAWTSLEKPEFEGGDFNITRGGPRDVAIKAANGIFHRTDKKDLKLKIRETTRGSSNRLREYRAKLNKVNKSFEAGGKTIRVRQEVDVEYLGVSDYDKNIKGGNRPSDQEIKKMITDAQQDAVEQYKNVLNSTRSILESTVKEDTRIILLSDVSNKMSSLEQMQSNLNRMASQMNVDHQVSLKNIEEIKTKLESLKSDFSEGDQTKLLSILNDTIAQM